MTSSDGSGLNPAPAPNGGVPGGNVSEADKPIDTSQGENGSAQEAEKSGDSESKTFEDKHEAVKNDAFLPPLNQAFNQEVKDRYEDGLAVADALPESPHLVDKEYVLATHLDPARQRDPNGIYLDDIQRRDAETVRARIEGREPDYDNPGTTAGDVLQAKETAAKFVDASADIPVHVTLPVMVGVPDKSDKE
jgi:hypothetical protein